MSLQQEKPSRYPVHKKFRQLGGLFKDLEKKKRVEDFFATIFVIDLD